MYHFNNAELIDCVESIKRACQARYASLDCFNEDIKTCEAVLAKYVTDPHLEIDIDLERLLGDAADDTQQAWIHWDVLRKRIVYVRSGEKLHKGTCLSAMPADFRRKVQDADGLRRLLDDAAAMLTPEDVDDAAADIAAAERDIAEAEGIMAHLTQPPCRAR